MIASKTAAMLKSSKFPKKRSWRQIKVLAHYLKGLAVFSIHKRELLPFKNVAKMQQPFLLGDNRSGVFEATTYFASSLS